MANELVAVTKIAIFRSKEIRKTIHKNEWWFVIVDVVAALTDSVQPEGILRICEEETPSLPKGGGKLPPPFRYRLVIAR